MSTTQYDLNGSVLTPARVASISNNNNAVIDLEQRLLAKMRRSGLMVGLSFEADWLTLTLFGSLSRHATASFKEFTGQLLKSGYPRFKIDLKNLEQLDGNGLAVLTWMTVQAHERKGQVVLTNAQPRIRRLMFTVKAQFMLELGDYDLAVG